MEGASIAIIASAIEAASPNLRKLTNDLVATMISGKRILQTANKLVRHRLLSLKSNKKLRVSTTFNIEGKNANKTWEECLNNFPSPQVVKGLTITTETLVNIKRFSEDYDGEYFKVSSLLDYLRLDSSCEEAIKIAALEFVPIIRVKINKKEERFYDRRQFFLNSQNVIYLYEASLQSEEEVAKKKKLEEEVAIKLKQKGPEKPERQPGSGRPKGSFKLRDPAIFKAVDEYMTLAGCGAHTRRREDIAKSGVTWSGDLYKFINDTFFSNVESKGPGKSSVRRLGVAPNKSRTAARLYRSEINAKPQNVVNQSLLGAPHLESQNCATNVRYALEFANLSGDYCTALSLDDKCKLVDGPSPAVSRYVKAYKTYTVGEGPSVPDHDLSVHKITPRGLLLLDLQREGLGTVWEDPGGEEWGDICEEELNDISEENPGDIVEDEFFVEGGSDEEPIVKRVRINPVDEDSDENNNENSAETVHEETGGRAEEATVHPGQVARGGGDGPVGAQDGSVRAGGLEQIETPGCSWGCEHQTRGGAEGHGYLDIADGGAGNHNQLASDQDLLVRAVGGEEGVPTIVENETCRDGGNDVQAVWKAKTVPDKYGRSHVAISRAGRGAVFFASARYSDSTIAAHCNDIR